MEITSPIFGTLTLRPIIVSRDDGVFWFEVSTSGSPSPVRGSAIIAKHAMRQHGECGSAHEAEFRAAKAMVEMAAEQRANFAEAEALLATRNSNHAAAEAAQARLEKL